MRRALCAVAFAALLGCAAASFALSGSSDPARAAPSALTGGDARPVWPQWFSTAWVIYQTPSETLPPYLPLPAPPYQAGRGATYYDWSVQSMLEVYDDFCVNVLPNGNDFPCHFLNTQNVSYLLTPQGSGANHLPPCCVYAAPWYPPAPNFLDNPLVTQNVSASLYGQPSDWYVLGGDFPAPFGYGFYADQTGAGTRVPSTFWFRGVEGYVSQDFQSFQPNKPDASVWDIPAACHNAVNCGVGP